MTKQNTTYHAKKVGNTHNNQPSKHKTKWVSIVTLLIAIICTVFVTFIVYKNLDNIQWERWSQEETREDSFAMGKEISAQGMLTNDGDVVSYSHRLHTAEHGTIGLKSRLVDLNRYDGQVEVHGRIDKVLWWIPIVEVDTILGTEKAEKTWKNLLSDTQGTYIPQAGIFFPSIFLEKYEIVNKQKVWEIKFKNKQSGQELSFSYFLCKQWDINKDCAKLNTTFAQISEKSFVAKWETSFYKLQEVTTRFFSQDKHRGYFISNVPEQEVIAFIEHIQFPNKEFVQETIVPYIDDICYNDQLQIQEIKKYELQRKWEQVTVNIQGTFWETNVDCVVEVDPSLPHGAKLVSFSADVEDAEDDEEEDSDLSEENNEEDSDENSNDDFDTNVTQFPINLEKTREFPSSRGYTITFPSGNITRRPGTVDDRTMGQAWVNCFNHVNVTKYNKEEPEIATTNPSVVVHECTIKNGFEDSVRYRHITTESEKDFVIEIIDPSRKDFADNTTIE